MAVLSNIVDLITTAAPKIKDGDYLIPVTNPAGYIGTYKESNGSIVKGQRLYQIKGQGSITTPGTNDSQTLTLGAATVSGNITVTLNGVTFTVAVAAGDTNAVVASKVSALVFTSAGYNDSVATNVVTFTATAHGIKPVGVFNGGTTGVTGTFAQTPGTNDIYAQYNVYPCIVASNGQSYQADTTQQPTIIQTAGQVVYQGGRNNLKQKDVYLPNGIVTISGITAGQEAKEVLKAFLAFSKEQYGFGVNDFQNGKPQYMAF